MNPIWQRRYMEDSLTSIAPECGQRVLWFLPVLPATPGERVVTNYECNAEPQTKTWLRIFHSTGKELFRFQTTAAKSKKSSFTLPA